LSVSFNEEFFYISSEIVEENSEKSPIVHRNDEENFGEHNENNTNQPQKERYFQPL
jgi:hypothetical protein